MFLRTGFLFVGSPFFIDFESELEKKTKGSEPTGLPRGMALSFNADFFHRPEFDLCPCVSIYAHVFQNASSYGCPQLGQSAGSPGGGGIL